jgi:hypothetical protein
MKGLIRKRSTTAARLQRALSSKAQSPSDTTGGPQTPGNRDHGLPRSGQDKRQFLMEAPVQFTTVSTTCGREIKPLWGSAASCWAEAGGAKRLLSYVLLYGVVLKQWRI